MCGAIFTSWLGAQGTLAGAMIGATIGSSVSEIVRAPLASLERRIIQAGVSVHQVRRDGLFKTIVSSPVAAQQVFGLVSRRAIITVAVVALVGFAVAMGGVTAVEVARGEPLAAIVTDEPATGTTLGHVIPNPPPVLAPAEDEDKTTATPGPTGDATPGATGTPPAGTGTPVGTGTPATTLTPPARTATAATAATAGISTATPARPTATSAARPTTSGSTPAPPAASPRPAP